MSSRFSTETTGEGPRGKTNSLLDAIAIAKRAINERQPKVPGSNGYKQRLNDATTLGQVLNIMHEINRNHPVTQGSRSYIRETETAGLGWKKPSGGSKKSKSTTTKRKSTTTKRKSTTTKRKTTTTKRKSTTTKRK